MIENDVNSSSSSVDLKEEIDILNQKLQQNLDAITLCKKRLKLLQNNNNNLLDIIIDVKKYYSQQT
jgi:hypothetical protein